MSQFFTLPTKIGQGLISNAIAYDEPLTIATMAIGDGGGKLPSPDASVTRLVNEVRRGPINQITTDPDNPNWIIAEQVLPPDVGGWTIREVGLYDTDGNLIAYGNYPETYKPQLSEGSSRTQTIRFVMETTDTSAVTLKIDPSVVMASRQYVDDSLKAHAESRNHPAADTKNLGLMRFATLVESKRGVEQKAAETPAGARAQIDQALASYGFGEFPPDLIIGTGNKYTSCNNATDQGVWLINSSASDKPADAGAGWIVVAGRNRPDYLAQTFQSNSAGGHRWERNCYNGQWSEWLPVVLGRDITDISSMRVLRLNNGGDQYAAFEAYRTLSSGSKVTAYYGAEANGGAIVGATNAATGKASALVIRPEGDFQFEGHGVWHGGNLNAATQGDVDAGDDDNKFITAKKLSTWFGRVARSATTSIRGLVRLARQDEVDSGAATDAVVTTRTLLGGALYVAGENGRLILPRWLGGFIFQWGLYTTSTTNAAYITFPLAFPAGCYYASVGGALESDNKYFYPQVVDQNQTRAVAAIYSGAPGGSMAAGTGGVSITLNYLAFGR